MTSLDWIEQVLALPDVTSQQLFLETRTSLLDDQVANALKEQADRFLRVDVNRSLETAGLLIHLGDLIDNPFFRALGLLAEANARCIGGLGEYQLAIDLYDQAAEIYRGNGRLMEQARSQTGKLYALAFLGRYAEAFEIGQWASHILETHGEWRLLAGLMVNLGLIHGRTGADEKALELFDQAKAQYTRLGEEGQPFLPWVDQNRSIVLRNLGSFEASIEASRRVCEALNKLGQEAEVARARQNLAVTYFVLGRHNEALKLLDQVWDIFWADGRLRDAILIELFISDCLLQLRRFPDVLDSCKRIREAFTKLGTRFEVGQALLNEAVAYAGLNDCPQAISSLAEARRLFEEEGNQVWVACADLEIAAVLCQEERFGQSLKGARSCSTVFQDHKLPIKEAQAYLIAAKSAAALHLYGQAHSLVSAALAVGERFDIPSLTYQSYHLLGALALTAGNQPGALAYYDRAVQELERLRGQLMVEYRVDFVKDKQVVYEDAFCLCLELAQPLRAMQYAERAKSRALLDILAYRLDLSIQVRDAADRPIVDELVQLRAERDRVYRRWEGREESKEDDWDVTSSSREQTRHEVLALEKRITELWHRLLIHNADYARDASLWRVRTEAIQPYLCPETVLLKFFVAHQQLFAFAITGKSIKVQRLSADLDQLRQLIQLVHLNLKTAAQSQPDQIIQLIPNVQGLLRRLHELLIAPLADAFSQCQKLIIVPHGLLHYLPFHALYDGAAFLLEQYEISYLPGASFLRYCHQVQPATSGLVLAIGHSHHGRIPHALEEANSIAALLNGRACLEEEATLTQLQETAGDCRVIHLAAHGEFRSDNPLFSGLALADGWLTTLDIFSLRLKASLVTLSACQTGQSVVGGGDELLGLMRAFSYAGAASLVLSQWTVDDCTTAKLMTMFYQKLVENWDKGAALRHAQLQFVHRNYADDATNRAAAHPYFWAPFFLVGHTGPL